MTFLIHNRRAVPEIRREIDRLRDLVDDLKRISRGEHPGRNRLANSPIIESWKVTERADVCLTGIVRGHPIIGDGRQTLTSSLWVLAPELGYARTFSRLYALGQPFTDSNFQ